MELNSAIQMIVMVLFPLLVLEIVKRNKMAGMIGPVILCYGVGLLAGNVSLIPVNKECSQQVFEAAVPIAISLMLLSTRFLGWLKYARRTAFSFLLAVISILTSSFVVSAIFKVQHMNVQDIWKLSGMMVGVYTGGTPNMAAIGTGLGISQETFIVINLCDLLISGLYLILLLTVAQKIALRFLPSFVSIKANHRDETFHYQRKQKIASNKDVSQSLFIALLISLSIVGASIWLSMMVGGKVSSPTIILTVTTLSIGASFIKKVRFLPRTYEFGEYFLLIFCLGIGSISDFGEMVHASPHILFYVSCVLIGTLLIHFTLSWIFKIDADTTLITSVAGIFGPAFIGPVASVLKNKDIVVSGLTTGLVGYAIGNYLGFGIAQLFHMVFP